MQLISKLQVIFTGQDPKIVICLFIYLFRSFMDTSSNVLSKHQAEEAIESMLHAAGFDNKDHITWEDFHLLLQDHENVLQFAQLNIKGVFLLSTFTLQLQQQSIKDPIFLNFF